MKKTSGSEKVIFFFTAFFAVIVIGNIFLNDKFFELTVGNSISAMISLYVAYYLTEIRNNERKYKEKAEDILNKIQVLVSEPSFTCDNYELREHRIRQRTLNNKITLLEKISQKLTCEDDVKYIRQQFDDYREFIDAHIEDVEHLKKSKPELMKFAANIENKCDEIKVNFYNNK